MTALTASLSSSSSSGRSDNFGRSNSSASSSSSSYDDNYGPVVGYRGEIIDNNDDEDDYDDDHQLFFVTSYSDFDKLAHGPRGTEAKHSVWVYRFHPSDGSLVLLNVSGEANSVKNPAFSRHHPRLNIVYTCTEDCHQNGVILAYKLNPSDGSLVRLGDPVDAGGTSTCYLTIDKAQRNLLAVNYWNSTIVTIPIDYETGELIGSAAGGPQHVYDPNFGKAMKASRKIDGGVNHSKNDDSTIKARQADPHSHAIVLDPYVGRVAYVPDLGKDVIREFYYDADVGKIELELNVLPSGLASGGSSGTNPEGPRYFEFHPHFNVAYVVNELSSTVAVFEVDRELLKEIYAASKNGEDTSRFKGRSTLRLVQTIKTIPRAFPTTMNTCGRMTVHKSGRFVVVSNRGHDSLAVFKVRQKGPKRGELYPVGGGNGSNGKSVKNNYSWFHTRGETPRHFQFDNSGQYLLVANQDTDALTVFNFNLSNGELRYSGNEYRIPSPNFVCCCSPNTTIIPVSVSANRLLMQQTATSGVGGNVEGINNNGSQNRTRSESFGDSSSSDGEGSTFDTKLRTKKTEGIDEDSNLKEELARAKREIEDLRKMLQAAQLQQRVA